MKLRPASQAEIDSRWWRTQGGGKWHLMSASSDGDEPWYTVCGISTFKLVEGRPDRPQANICLRCDAGETP